MTLTQFFYFSFIRRGGKRKKKGEKKEMEKKEKEEENGKGKKRKASALTFLEWKTRPGQQIIYYLPLLMQNLWQMIVYSTYYSGKLKTLLLVY